MSVEGGSPGGGTAVTYAGARLLPPATGGWDLVVGGGALLDVGPAGPPRTDRVVDLGGRLVTPAFGDAHVHLVQTGQVAEGVDLHGAPDRQAVLDAVAAARRRGVPVVVGQGWDDTGWPDPRPPTRTELDRAGGGAVVYLARVDVHSAAVSSALLQRVPQVASMAGFTADGVVSRDAHHACRRALDDAFPDADRRRFARTALQAAAAAGVATVHEMGGPHLGPLEDLRRVADVGAEVGIDVVGYWGERADDDVVAAATAAGARGLAGDLCVDGSIGSRTAALRSPYADAPAGAPPHGVRYLSDDEIADHLVACTRRGLQGGFHCIGDDAVAAAVAGLRRAAAVCGAAAVRRARHRLEHVEMLDPADAATLADLGVTASMQPAFDARWGGPDGLYARRLGPARAGALNALATLDRAGVPLALGTDSPVTPLAGWDTVRAAVTHRQPAERLGVARAFAAATAGVRAAAGQPADLLAAGARATFAVWDCPAGTGADGWPVLAPDAGLPRCALLVVAGRVVFSRLPGVGPAA